MQEDKQNLADAVVLNPIEQWLTDLWSLRQPEKEGYRDVTQTRMMPANRAASPRPIDGTWGIRQDPKVCTQVSDSASGVTYIRAYTCVKLDGKSLLYSYYLNEALLALCCPQR